MIQSIIKCNHCLMDNSIDGIEINESGKCNICIEVEKELSKYRFTPGQEENNLIKMKDKIINSSKYYDAVVGISGGIDSCYTTFLAHKLGLKILLVHFDNGWNNNIANSNIEKIAQKTNYDLETYVINWDEFKSLQRAYIKAGVIDIEAITDHAINATMFKFIRKHKIKYVLSGYNYVTEHGLPKSWYWSKQDWRNVKDINKKYGEKKLKTFPHLGFFRMGLIHKFGLGGKIIMPLEVINYDRDQAQEILESEYDWQSYGGKHHESRFTKFYQEYILPTKFGVDKRKVHLSAIIRNGKMSRAEGLKIIENPSYTPEQLQRDKYYVLKKLGFSEAEFDFYMQQEPIPHDQFNSDWDWYQPYKKLKFRILGK